MIERDFIKRIIQQLAQVLAQILLHKKSSNWEQVQMALDVAGKQMLGLNPDLRDNLDSETLIKLFSYNDKFDHEKCLVLAVILTESAINLAKMQADESSIFNAYKKGFTLYETAFQNRDLLNKEYKGYFELCVDGLLEFKLDQNTLIRIFSFYKIHNLFARAEDILSIILINATSENIILAKEFYQSLLKLDDKQLNKGNLPRDEIIEGLNRLHKMNNEIER